MDFKKEAEEYDEMDHSGVNRIFVDDLLVFAKRLNFADKDGSQNILDVGTGTALIPIELCSRSTTCNVVGIDFSDSMISKGISNIQNARLESQIKLIQCDAKKTTFTDNHFSLAISNSIVHHIPEPARIFQEMVRLLKPGGGLFVRDLLRPETNQEVENLVDLHAKNANDYQRQLFRQSLQASLTVQEVQAILLDMKIPADAVKQTSDRHWTLEFIATNSMN